VNVLRLMPCDRPHSAARAIRAILLAMGFRTAARDPIGINHKINKFSEIPSTEGLDRNFA
jgi:hypothetical protein